MIDINHVFILVTDLEKLHTKRLMVTFDTDDEEKEKEINAKTREITNLFRDAELMLKKFSSEERLQALEPADVKVRQNIQRAVAKRLQGLSMSFRRSQKVCTHTRVLASTVVFIICIETLIESG